MSFCLYAVKASDKNNWTIFIIFDIDIDIEMSLFVQFTLYKRANLGPFGPLLQLTLKNKNTIFIHTNCNLD